jgi:hypothetical protein
VCNTLEVSEIFDSNTTPAFVLCQISGARYTYGALIVAVGKVQIF